VLFTNRTKPRTALIETALNGESLYINPKVQKKSSKKNCKNSPRNRSSQEIAPKIAPKIIPKIKFQMAIRDYHDLAFKKKT
jgi:hypothetical protein